MNDETGTARPGKELPSVRGDVASPVEPAAPARLVPEVRLCAPSGSDSRVLGTQKWDTKRTLTPANSHILFPFCTE